MRLEEMKNNIPETPDFIHKMVQEEVSRQLQDTKVVPMKKRKWNKVQAAAAAALCLLATSTVAYAGNRLYHMYVEKQGNYRVETGIQADGGTSVQLPEQIHDVAISTNYIPDGMTWTDEDHLQYTAQNGGFTFSSVLLDSDDFEKAKEDKNIVESEEHTFGKYEGVYLRYHEVIQDGFFNQRIYLFCPEEYRVITIYVGDDVSKEDALKVADNLQITEKDTMIETAGMYTWSDIVSPEEVQGDEAVTSISADRLPVAEVGEKVDLTASGEDKDGNIYSKRVGTMVQRYTESSNGWVNDATYPILYGDITKHPEYKPYMRIQVEERYALNSQGKSVPIQEVGWAAEGELPTHIVLQFTSSHGGAYIGSPGNTMWIDNVELIY